MYVTDCRRLGSGSGLELARAMPGLVLRGRDEHLLQELQLPGEEKRTNFYPRCLLLRFQLEDLLSMW